jgi:hypothetical protein
MGGRLGSFQLMFPTSPLLVGRGNLALSLRLLIIMLRSLRRTEYGVHSTETFHQEITFQGMGTFGHVEHVFATPPYLINYLYIVYYWYVLRIM